MKTKGVVFVKANKFEMRELTLDKMGENDIAVRTLVTAISPGTERWILKGKHIGVEFPCVPGYHRIGVVVKTGKEVKNFQEGDIVYGFANRWKEEIHSMWGAHVGYSIGDQSEYEFIASTQPSAFELETTVFTILAAVAYRGIRFLELKAGEKMLIIGAGFVGICAAQLAKLQHVISVLVEKNKERVDFAKKLGLNVLWTDRKNFEAELKEIAPDGFDLIYDTAGVPAMIDKTVQQAKRWGRLLLQAQYFDKAHRIIDLDQIKIKELTLKTTIGTDEIDRKETFNLIKKKMLKIAPLITHRFFYEEALKGYNLLLKGTPFNLGIVTYWDKNLWNK